MSERAKKSREKKVAIAAATVLSVGAIAGIGSQIKGSEKPKEREADSGNVPSLKSLEKEYVQFYDKKKGSPFEAQGLEEVIRFAKHARSLTPEKVKESKDVDGLAYEATVLLNELLIKTRYTKTAPEIADYYYKPGVIEAMNERGVVFAPLGLYDYGEVEGTSYDGDVKVVPYQWVDNPAIEELGFMPDGFAFTVYGREKQSYDDFIQRG